MSQAVPRCDFFDRELLLQAAPQVLHLTDHYRDHPVILVDLAAIREDAMLDIPERAWRMTASKKLIQEYGDQTYGIGNKQDGAD